MAKGRNKKRAQAAIKAAANAAGVVISKASYAPFIPYVPAMNAFIKKKEKSWQFSADVAKVADKFYDLYVKKKNFSFDEDEGNNFEDKVEANMNSYTQEIDTFIPPQAIQLAVTVVVSMVTGIAKKVKDGKASKEEAAIVAATAEAEAKANEAAAKEEAKQNAGGNVPSWVYWVVGSIIAAIIAGLIIKALSKKG